MAKLRSEKREIFCLEYCKDLNATQAAIRAGYSARSAASQAWELMRKPDIRARIDELQATRAAKLNLDAEYVLQNLIEVKDRCMQKTPVMVFDQAERRMVQAMEVDEDGNAHDLWTFDSRGANNALELIGKHLAMFKDQVLVTNVPEIVDDV